MLLFGEPYSTDANAIIEYFAEELPGVAIVGGMASGGDGPGSNRLFLNQEAVVLGAIGAIIRSSSRQSGVSSSCSGPTTGAISLNRL